MYDIQLSNIQIVLNHYNEPKIRSSKNDSFVNESKTKEMKVDISFNGHLENCVCKKCHEAREMLKALRLM